MTPLILLLLLCCCYGKERTSGFALDAFFLFPSQYSTWNFPFRACAYFFFFLFAEKEKEKKIRKFKRGRSADLVWFRNRQVTCQITWNHMIYARRTQGAKPSSPPWAVLPPPAALVAPRELLTKVAESQHFVRSTLPAKQNQQDKQDKQEDNTPWMGHPRRGPGRRGPMRWR